MTMHGDCFIKCFNIQCKYNIRLATSRPRTKREQRATSSLALAAHVSFVTRHFLIPWTGGAFSPPGPFLCPTTEKKYGLLPQSQGPKTYIK